MCVCTENTKNSFNSIGKRQKMYNISKIFGYLLKIFKWVNVPMGC